MITIEKIKKLTEEITNKLSNIKLTTKELMEKHWLHDKTFSYGMYVGQEKRARELAIKKYGIEKVALMSDTEIEREFRKEGLIPMQIAYENGCDCEMVYLVPIEILDTLEVLSR